MVVQQVLVYSDSLARGIIPLTRNRLPFDARWPGVTEKRLNAPGAAVRVIEDCRCHPGGEAGAGCLAGVGPLLAR